MSSTNAPGFLNPWKAGGFLTPPPNFGLVRIGLALFIIPLELVEATGVLETDLVTSPLGFSVTLDSEPPNNKGSIIALSVTDSTVLDLALSSLFSVSCFLSAIIIGGLCKVPKALSLWISFNSASFGSTTTTAGGAGVGTTATGVLFGTGVGVDGVTDLTSNITTSSSFSVAVGAVAVSCFRTSTCDVTGVEVLETALAGFIGAETTGEPLEAVSVLSVPLFSVTKPELDTTGDGSDVPFD
ncbi:hypothetical protein WICPIJ_003608 [Wickerhamomyces pijperi]|uniref:Uncharacterized protein n=1 Tax=Wickerhamomyces pijperi TaxID=599730 RepID=A0A9P8Q7C0_WICPI|nr:hypothetical protein WICPIJ_003608 [Wickerhamomyces pijperi]